MIAVLEITRIHSHPVAEPAFMPAASLMVVNVEIQEWAILTALLAAAVFRAVFHTTLYTRYLLLCLGFPADCPSPCGVRRSQQFTRFIKVSSFS
jgi:hypothetical protein